MGGDAFASAPIGLICPIGPISPIYCAKFCINPASQAFPPSHLGIAQASLPSALGLSSVLHFAFCILNFAFFHFYTPEKVKK